MASVTAKVGVFSCKVRPRGKDIPEIRALTRWIRALISRMPSRLGLTWCKSLLLFFIYPCDTQWVPFGFLFQKQKVPPLLGNVPPKSGRTILLCKGTSPYTAKNAAVLRNIR
jgi:hypothetical protein